MPRDSGAAAAAGQGAGDGGCCWRGGAGNAAATDTRPGGGLGTPLDPEGTNDPWAKYKWWILGGLGLLLAGGAGIMLKNDGTRRRLAPVAAGTTVCRGAECSAGGVEGRVVCGGDGQAAGAAERERVCGAEDRA